MGFGQFIYDYQTLIGAAAAIAAAYVAVRPVWRQLELTQTQANGVLREMLLHRQAELTQAQSALIDKVGRPLNNLAFELDVDMGGTNITEHEAHQHDMGLSQAVSWLRQGYNWRDSSKAEAAKNAIIEKIDALLSVLSDVHAPAHTDQSGEDYAMTDEQWSAFVARGEEAKGEVPAALAEAQEAYREFWTSLETEKSVIGVRLRNVNDALALIP